MRRTAVVAWLLGALLLAACGGHDATRPPPVPDLSGPWNLFESIADDAHAAACTAEGTLMLAAAGTALTGSLAQTGTCTSPAGTVDVTGTGTLVVGQILGDSVAFVVNGCTFRGGVTGDPPARIDGPVTCDLSQGGASFHYAGSWIGAR